MVILSASLFSGITHSFSLRGRRLINTRAHGVGRCLINTRAHGVGRCLNYIERAVLANAIYRRVETFPLAGAPLASRVLKHRVPFIQWISHYPAQPTYSFRHRPLRHILLPSFYVRSIWLYGVFPAHFIYWIPLSTL